MSAARKSRLIQLTPELIVEFIEAALAIDEKPAMTEAGPISAVRRFARNRVS